MSVPGSLVRNIIKQAYSSACDSNALAKTFERLLRCDTLRYVSLRYVVCVHSHTGKVALQVGRDKHWALLRKVLCSFRLLVSPRQLHWASCENFYIMTLSMVIEWLPSTVLKEGIWYHHWFGTNCFVNDIDIKVEMTRLWPQCIGDVCVCVYTCVHKIQRERERERASEVKEQCLYQVLGWNQSEIKQDSLSKYRGTFWLWSLFSRYLTELTVCNHAAENIDHMQTNHQCRV